MTNKDKSSVVLEVVQDGNTLEKLVLGTHLFKGGSGILALLELDEESIISIYKPSLKLTFKYYYKDGE